MPLPEVSANHLRSGYMKTLLATSIEKRGSTHVAVTAHEKFQKRGDAGYIEVKVSYPEGIDLLKTGLHEPVKPDPTPQGYAEAVALRDKMASLRESEFGAKHFMAHRRDRNATLEGMLGQQETYVFTDDAQVIARLRDEKIIDGQKSVALTGASKRYDMGGFTMATGNRSPGGIIRG